MRAAWGLCVGEANYKLLKHGVCFGMRAKCVSKLTKNEVPEASGRTASHHLHDWLANGPAAEVEFDAHSAKRLNFDGREGVSGT